MADCNGLENRQRRKAFEGSNPSPSASDCSRWVQLGHPFTVAIVKLRRPSFAAAKHAFRGADSSADAARSD